MSLLVTLTADVLVAILLVATIVSCIRLSRRIARMKADEAGMRQTIGELMVASTTAERAVAGLRATLDECDRTLADRLATAERYAADLSTHVAAGEAVIGRISAIVAQAGGGQTGAGRTQASTLRAPPMADTAVRPHPQIVPPQTRTPAEVPASPNGERLGAAAAAALAMSERALGRLRSKAA
ncbi:glutamyl-tRNA reductase [Methylobacterium sp. Leaf469]|uniref:DUF6468 domain-containing protein n=1 Tax=unclassified Methylobacterium TaxID=2615210 RepID=UPI000700F78D|nr:MULTISPECIES: DUF6468 domain-containing protein [unclassified Methylobacterium]USU32829.1 DUF6468 domain-containing protein [Methylobacterium sp. OTU13CASTA1]KQP30707.1 glutamyl-tRNA reductase [Methylobacterium sp. Leaf102]KQP31429.1 glutamyl-tRNA reductase [Methylobacterium sp. Leaf100]KQP67625.1 glutamyl-tRNA reductase [Methylobacterium sp. Leaf112]KQT98795.1 glutamyl-tRNA reductase [Methylobacterium sp. Leaf469]